MPWVQDLWPQSLEVTGFVRKRWLLSIIARFVCWLYSHSDLLLVQSRGFITSVSAMSGGTPVEYHPNPGDLASNSDEDGAASELLQSGFNVVFAGNLGTVQALDTVLAAAKMLRDLQDVRIVLIGSGSRSEWIRQELKRLELANVELLGRYAAQAMPGIFIQASALLVSLVRDPIMSQTIPSKIQAYLAAGRPIIASLDGEGARVVEDAKAGLTCPAEDPVALAEAVRKLHAASPEMLAKFGASGRQYYEKHFEPSMLAKKLTDRFVKLLEARGQGISGKGEREI